ncbi:MAG: pilus assembly protein TadE [Alteraurantiacibacter sp.]|nr:pilus assembly protein TadE [Alteraurantiacibacter sp.]
MNRRAPLAVLGARLRHFVQAEHGLSVTEFALVLPVFLSACLMGIEVANMALINMRVGDIATSVADNASRLGQTDNSAVVPTITEADIASVMQGAREQGESIGLVENGRVILSSLETVPGGTRQYIHWQRCMGELDASSAYGPAGYGLTGDPIAGLGRPGAELTAPPGQAVMYAEVVYRYQPMLANLLFDDMIFRQEAAFIVRDDRNLQGNGGTGVGGAAGVNTCD